MPNDRSINTLRGLACLLLVLYHVIGSDATTGLHQGSGPLRFLNDGLAFLRMPLFTFLSGLVYGRRPFVCGADDFLTGKARRLLLPMLVVGTAFAVVQSLTPEANAGTHAWFLLHIVPVGHFWFVESLFWIFAIAMALEHLQWLSSRRRFAGVWLVATAIYLNIYGTRLLGINGAIYLFPYFLGGLAVARFPIQKHLNVWPMRVALLATLVTSVAAMGMPVPNPDRQTVGMLLAGLSSCLLLSGWSFNLRPMALIGASSYTIYIYHVFFTAATRIALNRFHVADLAVHLVLGLVVGIAGPMLLEKMVARQEYLRGPLLGMRR